MKLEEVEITDFRGIKHLKLDFRDELGRVRDRIPIVGPNTSGKTTILDAISLCLMPVTEIVNLRSGLVLSPPSIVRRGALQARVVCTVRFSDLEIDAARAFHRRVGNPYSQEIPETNQVKVHWEYPHLQGKFGLGLNKFEPRNAWTLFKLRCSTARSLHVPGISPIDFQNCGGVFLFDQQRTGLGQKISDVDRELFSQQSERYESHTTTPPPPGDIDSYAKRNTPSTYTQDPREILLKLATRAQAAQDAEATEREDYRRLCELYAHVCHPHVIRGMYNTEFGLDMEFVGDQGAYRFDGLSSGQQMILLLLLQFATKHIHRSIVLIDELELHLHPLWQTRLYESLPGLGVDNQFLFTIHSTHLRDSISEDFVHTGELGETVIATEGA